MPKKKKVLNGDVLFGLRTLESIRESKPGEFSAKFKYAQIKNIKRFRSSLMDVYKTAEDIFKDYKCEYMQIREELHNGTENVSRNAYVIGELLALPEIVPYESQKEILDKKLSELNTKYKECFDELEKLYAKESDAELFMIRIDDVPNTLNIEALETIDFLIYGGQDA
jgi:chromosome segregation ATPase